jgi:hypothetical protein
LLASRGGQSLGPQGSSRAGALRELIKERGCELIYPPPYSPDLNPIEQAFSKVKGLSRRAEARSTCEALVEAMGRALGAVTTRKLGGRTADGTLEKGPHKWRGTPHSCNTPSGSSSNRTRTLTTLTAARLPGVRWDELLGPRDSAPYSCKVKLRRSSPAYASHFSPFQFGDIPWAPASRRVCHSRSARMRVHVFIITNRRCMRNEFCGYGRLLTDILLFSATFLRVGSPLRRERA